MIKRVQQSNLPRLTRGLWIIYLLVLTAAMLQSNASFDFRIYYNLTETFHNQGAGVYDGIITGIGHKYLYPPLFVIILEPFVNTIERYPLSILWYMFNVGVFFYTLRLIANEFASHSIRQWTWLMPVFFFPVFNAFFHGQVTFIIFALLVGCWIAYLRDRHYLAGGMLALAAWIKVFPAFIVIWLLLRRQWQVVQGVALVGIVLLLLQGFLGGIEPLETYFLEVLPHFSVEGQPDSNFASNSINSFSAKLFQDTKQVNPLSHNDRLFNVTKLALTLGFVGSLLWGMFLPGLLTRQRFNLEFSMILVLSRLLGSHMHNYDMVIWLLPFVVTLDIARTHPQRERIALWSLLAFALITMGYPFVLGMDGASASGLVYATPFFGATILWVIQIALLVDMSAGQQHQQTPPLRLQPVEN